MIQLQELWKTARSLSATQAARQSSLLYASEIVLLVSGFIASLIVTRLLGPADFGVYSYVLGLVAFIGLFFEFGLHTTAARMLAITTSLEDQRRFISNFAWIALGLGVMLAGTVAAVALIGFGIKETYLPALLLIAPFTISFPFVFFFENVCQGTNRIRVLSLYNASINLLFLLIIAALAWSGTFQLTSALFGYYAAVIFSTLLTLAVLRPGRAALRKDWPAIAALNRSYGIRVFWGRVATVATYNLDKILIAAFSTAASVGYYSLAYAIAQPLSLFSRAISFSLFRDFSAAQAVSPRVFKINSLWLALTTVVLIVGGWFLLEPIFTSAFAPAKTILPILALAVAFQGLYEPYNKFLVARGEGQRIQRITFTSAGLNLLVNLIMIYYYGAVGAALASLLSMAVTFFLYRREYHRLLKENHVQD